MNTLSRRKFLRFLPATPLMLPAVLAQYSPYGMPLESEEKGLTLESVNNLQIQEMQAGAIRDITIKWLVLNVTAMKKCFHGCGMVPKQRSRA